MSGQPVYCGADPADASSMDMAWLSFFYGASLGLVQGIAICQAAKLDPHVFLKATPSYLQEILAVSVDFERQTGKNHRPVDDALLFPVYNAGFSFVHGEMKMSPAW
jgi:hypothetical protein